MNRRINGGGGGGRETRPQKHVHILRLPVVYYEGACAWPQNLRIAGALFKRHGTEGCKCVRSPGATAVRRKGNVGEDGRQGLVVAPEEALGPAAKALHGLIFSEKLAHGGRRPDANLLGIEGGEAGLSGSMPPERCRNPCA